jgi:nitroreductase
MTETQDRTEVRNEAVLDALRRRRSMPQVREEAPPRELVEAVIEAATWAPNHHRTEPWRFVVIAGQERSRFGEFLAETRRAQLADPESEEGRRALEKERGKLLRAPVVIVVAAVPTGHPKAVPIEEIQAVAAGVENMLLAAEAYGLHAMWRTGWPAESPEVKRYLGLPEDAHIVSFVYLGYPSLPQVPRERKSAAPFISWKD